MIFCLSFKGLKIMIILAFLLFLFCVNAFNIYHKT